VLESTRDEAAQQMAAKQERPGRAERGARQRERCASEQPEDRAAANGQERGRDERHHRRCVDEDEGDWRGSAERVDAGDGVQKKRGDASAGPPQQQRRTDHRCRDADSPVRAPVDQARHLLEPFPRNLTPRVKVRVLKGSGRVFWAV
jgi:hypothetical protein